MNQLIKRKPISGSRNPNWRGGKAEIECITCGARFFVIPSRAKKAKCCSLYCWNTYQIAHPAPPPNKGVKNPSAKGPTIIQKHCKNCGDEFTIEFARRNQRTFCGSVCRIKWRTANLSGENHPRFMNAASRECAFCGIKFKRKAKVKYCSIRCRSNHLKGSLSPAWKGGRTAEHSFRMSREYLDWKKAVRKRDNGTCRNCGANKVRINVHHIKRYATNPDLRTTLSNGISLCDECHRMVHGKEEQHEEYLMRLP